jgi:hypothetical protein
MKNKFFKLFIILFILCVSIHSLSAQNFSIQPTKAFYENLTFKKSERKIFNEIIKTYSSIEKVNTISFEVKSRNDLDTRLQQNIDTTFNYAEVYTIDPLKTYHYLKEQRPKALTLSIPFKGETILVDLIEVNLLGSEFEIKADDMSKVKDAKIGLYYQGIIRGEESFATFNVFENEVNGIFHNEKGDKQVEFGKIRNTYSNYYILYDEKDIANKLDKVCNNHHQETFTIDTTYKKVRTYNCFTNWWDIGYDLYVANNSSTQDVINMMTSIYNNFNLVYSNEQIGTSLNTLYIFTSQDPWLSSANSMSTHLNIYGNGRTGFGTQLATLFTTYVEWLSPNSYVAGISWLQKICTGPEFYLHNVVGGTNINIVNYPNASGYVKTLCHEDGHQFGSPHTHDCVWNGNNTALDNCGGAACANTGQSGTIMSYCSGFPLSNGFGIQPGNKIRNVAGCLAFQQCNPSGGVSTFCAAATNLQASSITFNTANLTWTNSASASNYYVMIKPSAAANYTNVSGNIGANSFVLSNLIPNTTYNVRVYTNCSNGALYYASTSFTTLNQVCNIALDVATNGTIAGAATIPFNTNANGYISSNTDIDFYKYIKNTNKPVSISLLDYGNNYDIKLYKSNGMLVANSTLLGTSKVINYAGVAGSYYVKVFGKTATAFNTNVCYQLRVNYNGIMLYEPIIEESCSVYPNPAFNLLTLEINSIQHENEAIFMLKDLTGRKVKSTTFKLVEGTNNIEIDISTLSSGNYIGILETVSGFKYQTKITKL